jgi:putative hydrolase of the HAD superfamily
MTPKIKIILFDVAGVLFLANSVVGEAIEAKFGLTRDQTMPMWKGIYRQFSTGKMDPETFYDGVAEILNVARKDVDEELFTSSFIKSLKPTPGMAQLLDKLSKNTTVKLAVLSDTTIIHNKTRSSKGYYRHFEKVFLSFEIGYCKPDPMAYKTVIDYFKIDPNQILFIDDRAENVVAARAVGMQAEVFNSAPELEKQLTIRGLLTN